MYNHKQKKVKLFLSICDDIYLHVSLPFQVTYFSL